MLVGKQTPRKNVQLVDPPSENTTGEVGVNPYSENRRGGGLIHIARIGGVGVNPYSETGKPEWWGFNPYSETVKSGKGDVEGGGGGLIYIVKL